MPDLLHSLADHPPPVPLSRKVGTDGDVTGAAFRAVFLPVGASGRGHDPGQSQEDASAGAPDPVQGSTLTDPVRMGWMGGLSGQTIQPTFGDGLPGKALSEHDAPLADPTAVMSIRGHPSDPQPLDTVASDGTDPVVADPTDAQVDPTGPPVLGAPGQGLADDVKLDASVDRNMQRHRAGSGMAPDPFSAQDSGAPATAPPHLPGADQPPVLVTPAGAVSSKVSMVHAHAPIKEPAAASLAEQGKRAGWVNTLGVAVSHGLAPPLAEPGSSVAPNKAPYALGLGLSPIPAAFLHPVAVPDPVRVPFQVSLAAMAATSPTLGGGGAGTAKPAERDGVAAPLASALVPPIPLAAAAMPSTPRAAAVLPPAPVAVSLPTALTAPPKTVPPASVSGPLVPVPVLSGAADHGPSPRIPKRPDEPVPFPDADRVAAPAAMAQPVTSALPVDPGPNRATRSAEPVPLPEPGSLGVLGPSIPGEPDPMPRLPELQPQRAVDPPPTPVASIARQIAQTILLDSRTDRAAPIDIALDPPELGRVRLSMVEHNGVLNVVIAVERSETADLMRRHVSLLAEEFLRAGLDAPAVSISHGDTTGRGGHHPAQSGSTEAQDGPNRGPRGDAIPLSPTRPSSDRDDGGLDLRL